VGNAGKQVLGKRFVGVDVPASRRLKRSLCRSVLGHVIRGEILFANERDEGRAVRMRSFLGNSFAKAWTSHVSHLSKI